MSNEKSSHFLYTKQCHEQFIMEKEHARHV